MLRQQTYFFSASCQNSIYYFHLVQLELKYQKTGIKTIKKSLYKYLKKAHNKMTKTLSKIKM